MAAVVRPDLMVVCVSAGAVGTSTLFLMYSVSCVVAVLFIALFVPETKDKSLEQVNDAICVQQQRIRRMYVTFSPAVDPAMSGSPPPSPLTNLALVATRDSNPEPVFSIPGFGIGGFLIPGSRDPGGIMGSRRYDIKNRYFGPILLHLRFGHSVTGLCI